MPFFNDPADPPGMRQGGRLLFRTGGIMLDLAGWATVAVGVSAVGSRVFWLAAIGAAVGLFQLRAPIATTVTEVVLLAALLTLAPAGRADWVWTGAVLIVAGRALAFALLRLRRDGADTG